MSSLAKRLEVGQILRCAQNGRLRFAMQFFGTGHTPSAGQRTASRGIISKRGQSPDNSEASLKCAITARGQPPFEKNRFTYRRTPVMSFAHGTSSPSSRIEGRSSSKVNTASGRRRPPRSVE